MRPSRAVSAVLSTAITPLPRSVVPSLHHLNSRYLRTRPSRPGTPSSPPDSSSAEKDASSAGQTPSPPPDMSSMLSQMPAEQNNLLAPVHIPEDPRAVLRSDHPATSLLTQSGVVVQRQIEMMNVFLGFEQANRYVLMDPQGQHIGYLAEHDGGIAKTMGRQWFRTHRAFTTHIFDRHQQEVLRFHRPFSWINTTIRVYDPLEASGSVPVSSETGLSTKVKDNTLDGMHHLSSVPLSAMRIIGETHSEWAPLRRKYNLFLAHQLPSSAMTGSEPVPSDLSAAQKQQVAQQDNFAQFAYIDEPFLSWDFSLKGADSRLIGSVNRNWGGLGREFFTDTGTYVLRMDAVGLEEEAQKHHNISQSHQGERAYVEAVGGAGASGMTLDQRAVMLATAVTIDFDYFSRHSHGGSIIPMPLMMGGGTAAEGGAAGGAAGAAGAGAEAGALGETVSGTAAGTAGRVAGSVGAGEGAIAGAGTMAGYEAMQRGLGRGDQADSGQSEPPPSQYGQSADPQSPQYGQEFDPQSPQYGAPPEQMPGQPGQGQNPGEGGGVWGSGDSDPWSEGSNAAGEGGSEGGIISKIWEMFNDS